MNLISKSVVLAFTLSITSAIASAPAAISGAEGHGKENRDELVLTTEYDRQTSLSKDNSSNDSSINNPSNTQSSKQTSQTEAKEKRTQVESSNGQ